MPYIITIAIGFTILCLFPIQNLKKYRYKLLDKIFNMDAPEDILDHIIIIMKGTVYIIAAGAVFLAQYVRKFFILLFK